MNSDISEVERDLSLVVSDGLHAVKQRGARPLGRRGQVERPAPAPRRDADSRRVVAVLVRDDDRLY